jgi:hypothetical protein
VIQNRRAVTWAVALFPLAFVLLMVIGKLFVPGGYAYLITEDNVVEYATSLAYLLAGGLAAALALDLGRKAARLHASLYWLFSIGLFVIAMEEISWGQRILGLDTPEFFEKNNAKEEIGFHNMYGYPLHITFLIVGAYGAFARMLMPSDLSRRYPTLVEFFTPPYLVFLYFLIPFLLYAYYEYLYHRYKLPLQLEWSEAFRPEDLVDGKDQEPIELLLALGFLLFVMINTYQYRYRPAAT